MISSIDLALTNELDSFPSDRLTQEDLLDTDLLGNQSLVGDSLVVAVSTNSDGLVMHLTFDETSPDKAAEDAAEGKEDRGKLKDGATYIYANKELGGAVLFDGLKSYVEVKDKDEVNKDTHSQHTVSVWFVTDNKNIGDRKQVIYAEGGEKEGLNIYLDNGRLYVGGWNESKDDKKIKEGNWKGTYLSTDRVASGTWHNVTLVLDAEADNLNPQPSGLLAYLDGVKFGEGTGTLIRERDKATIGNPGKATQFHDGDVKDKIAKSQTLSGSVADVQVYDRALTADEVASLAGLDTPSIPTVELETRSLDGSGNNLFNVDWGRSNTQHSRVADSNYADGISQMTDGPEPRYISNRIFNDLHVNLFSENDVSHWSFIWGQFIDHTFSLGEAGGENAPIAFDINDPLEDFKNVAGDISFRRSAPASGTGENSPREQNNTISSYIDGWAIYGGTEERLEWLREGSVDGDLSNNGARLLLDNGYLPRANARGDASTAPEMDLPGRLRSDPGKAMVAGDVRANENIGLTGAHTLFVREHNRIVDSLPNSLDEETKFQIARKIVGAEQQYITYNEFLPAMGVRLDSYQGYDPNVNASLSNEFATIGYRPHSAIHGNFDFEPDKKRYSKDELEAFEEQGIIVDKDEIEVPLNVAFGNPDIVAPIGLDTIVQGLAKEAAYNNDEQIDNQLRSILFQLPINPDGNLDGSGIENNFNIVSDLGAIDVQRGRDHGVPFYNDLRVAYGLSPVQSFGEITGESSELFPNDPEIDLGDPINDPNILDVQAVFDEKGKVEADAKEIQKKLQKGEEVEGITSVQRTPVAARLKAIYGDVNLVDAFVGMIAEEHLSGSEFGELQHAMWKQEFENLRDGDRFFYLNDPDLAQIKARYGISYEYKLSDIITNNTNLDSEDIQDNVFIVDN